MIFSTKIIDLKHFNPTLINYINDIVKNNGFVGTIIVLENTKGLTSEMVSLINKSNKLKFRITGGFDNKRVSQKKENKKLIEEEYIDSITYTREELYNILVMLEKLEENTILIGDSLSKVFYLYECLRKNFNYKYDLLSTTKEENSLRGIITKNISPKGVALLYKELLDRQGINAYYVEGEYKSEIYEYSSAWNIVEIDGKFISLDLYLDINENKNGYVGQPLYFGEVGAFSKSHIPNNNETIQYYENALTSISKGTLLDIEKNISEMNTKRYVIYTYKRKDGSEILYSFLDKEKIENIEYQKIMYFDINNKILLNQKLMYLDSNIKILNNEIYVDEKKLTVEEENYLHEEIFKLNNVKHGYIGNLKYEEKLIFSIDNVNSHYVINKQKTVERNNKTSFVLEQINIKNNEEIYSSGMYKIYELLYDNKNYIYENIIYTEKDIFNIKDDGFYEEVLSRKNIESIIKDKHGYLEYFNPTEIKIIEKKE